MKIEAQDTKVIDLWPNYIGHKTNPSHEQIEADLIQFTNDYVKRKLPRRSSPENTNLFESEYEIFAKFAADHPALRQLESFLANGFMEIAHAANERVWEVRDINVSDLKVEFTSSWFIRYDNGGYVGPHIHGDSS
ncbi:MAG: hypothetical protein NZ961_04155, partial [Candidatus Poribacteria bacterium]|nr:hypothetical protein [Candidatus Poribacteria bacterium]